MLDDLSNENLQRINRKISARIHAEVVALWLTDRHRTTRQPPQMKCAQDCILLNLFWDALPKLYNDLTALASLPRSCLAFELASTHHGWAATDGNQM
jgi:hypothetical protein